MMKTSHRSYVPSCLVYLLIAVALLLQSPLTKAQSGVMRPRTSAPPPSSSTVQTSGQSTVKGRVFYKDNAQPLKGTRVRIFTSSDFGLVAFTNNSGEFRADNLLFCWPQLSLVSSVFARPIYPPEQVLMERLQSPDPLENILFLRGSGMTFLPLSVRNSCAVRLRRQRGLR